MSYWDEFPDVAADLDRVRNMIRDGLRVRDGGLSTSLDELMAGDGKMLRPGFVLLSARIGIEAGLAKRFRRLPTRVYRIAAAIEMLHMATLAHDDIIDGAATRRGKPSLYASRGAKQAVLVGDFLFSRCFSLVADHATLKNARILSRAVAHICAGELAQNRRFELDTLSIRDYKRRVFGKTAMLFLLAFHAGAVEVGVPPEVVERLRRIGYNVGMAFQIADDLLDFEGDSAILGKPVGGDLRDGIFTLPVIIAARNCPEVVGCLARDSLGTPSGLSEAVGRIAASGALGETRAAAAEYTHRAGLEVARLPSTQSRRVLQAVLGRTATRQA